MQILDKETHKTIEYFRMIILLIFCNNGNILALLIDVTVFITLFAFNYSAKHAAVEV